MSSIKAQQVLPPVRTRTRVRPSPSNEATELPPEDDGDPTPYSVGYKKPPLHTRWQKGQSGNPKGPRKRVKSLNTIVREIMNAPVTIRSGGREEVISRAQALVLKTAELASKGNDRALERLLRLYAATMPDDGGGLPSTGREHPLTATDEATLHAVRELMAADLERKDSK